MSFKILGTGSFLPQKVLTNDDLSKIVDTSDEWITQRVGVKERRVCTTESNTYMAVEAANSALKNSFPTRRSSDLKKRRRCPGGAGHDYRHHNQRGQHLSRDGLHGSKPYRRDLSGL